MAGLPSRVAVSGGAGFIGWHTVELLHAAGVGVLVIDDMSHACGAELPPEVELLVADCGSDQAAAALRAFAPQAVLHLAARGGVARALRDPEGHVRSAVASSIGCFSAAHEAGATAVVTASSGGALYGDSPVLPADEEQPLRPRSAYGASKAAEELYLATFGRQHGSRTLALRYANVYGPRQDGTGEAGVVAITARKLCAGAAPIIRGDGLQTRDFVFVGDVARANLAALSLPATGAVNVGTARETTVVEVVGTLARLHGTDSPLEHAPGAPGEVRRGALANARAADWLGWTPQVELEEGLRRTLAHFVAHHAYNSAASSAAPA